MGRVYTDPRDRAYDLHADETEADGQLRARARVAWTLHHRLQPAVEYARYAVCFRKQSRVTHRQRQSESDAEKSAGEHRRFGDHHERH